MPAARAILHVDMDAFFASIAVLDDPSLAGRPVLTGGTGPRAVVTTASYQARRHGCRSAMPMATARRLCPDAAIVQVPGARIRELSDAVFRVLDQFSPLVQPISVDEAFLDVTGSVRLLGDPPAIAKQIKATIHDTTGLTASVGVSFNKFLAKLASDMDKPDGLTIITPANLDAMLLPLPVDRIWGVGPKLARRLARHRIHRIADLRPLDRPALARLFGDAGERLFDLCRGIDHRPVTPDRSARSIGQEQTFDQDIQDRRHLLGVLLDQAQQVGHRLRAGRLEARTVTVKIRFGDFQTITRATTLDPPTDLTDDLFHAARTLFERWADTAFQPVRLLGLTASGFGQTTQPSLFTDPTDDRRRQIDALSDRITARFGKRAIHRGGPNP